jgi:hypothetical protein
MDGMYAMDCGVVAIAGANNNGMVSACKRLIWDDDNNRDQLVDRCLVDMDILFLMSQENAVLAQRQGTMTCSLLINVLRLQEHRSSSTSSLRVFLILFF